MIDGIQARRDARDTVLGPTWIQKQSHETNLLPVIEHSNRTFQYSHTYNFVCYPLRNVSRLILDAVSDVWCLGSTCWVLHFLFVGITKPHQVLGEHPKGCQEETLLHVLSGDLGSNQYLWMVYASVLPDLFEKIRFTFGLNMKR